MLTCSQGGNVNSNGSRILHYYMTVSDFVTIKLSKYFQLELVNNNGVQIFSLKCLCKRQWGLCCQLLLESIRYNNTADIFKLPWLIESLFSWGQLKGRVLLKVLSWTFLYIYFF